MKLSVRPRKGTALFFNNRLPNNNEKKEKEQSALLKEKERSALLKEKERGALLTEKEKEKEKENGAIIEDLRLTHCGNPLLTKERNKYALNIWLFDIFGPMAKFSRQLHIPSGNIRQGLSEKLNEPTIHLVTTPEKTHPSPPPPPPATNKNNDNSTLIFMK